MGDLEEALVQVVGTDHVLVGDSIGEDYLHDEALNAPWVSPRCVVRPASTDEVAAIMKVAAQFKIPVTARGAGTGLSGSCIARHEGLLISLERMDQVLEVDVDNHTVTVQPGVQLNELDEVLAPLGLVYPVFPGEYSASLGGNVNTNAGGMRAVKYGVTRHHVLGIEAVLANGEVIRSGGKVVKISTGYDLTQLIVGSEGTLAIVTEATLKLQPRLPFAQTVLAPFATVDEVASVVPRAIDTGLTPQILEYIDIMTMAAMTASGDLDLGVPEDVKNQALAYLVIVLENREEDRLEADIATLAEFLVNQGAIDVYVLPPGAATQIIEARERAFWLAKAANANDVIDVVVPRASIPEFLYSVSGLAAESSSFVAGCGHAGDGNVHMGVFQPDEDLRHELLMKIFTKAMDLGGAISGEHGIGTEKREFLLQLEDPEKLALMRRIKAAFDPDNLLNPGAIF